VVPGLAVAVVAAIAALPTVDNGSASPPWVVEGVQEVDDDVVAAAEDAGSVLVRFSPHFYTGAFGPPLLAALQDAGVPFYVDEATLVRQLGNGRRFEPGDATVELRVIADRVSDPDPDQELVAEWSDLSDDDRAELDRLDEQVEDLVAEHGLPLADGAEDFLERAHDRETQEQIAELEDDPAEAVASGLVRELWSGQHATFLDGPLLDTDVFPRRLLDRWADLRLRAEERVLQVYMGPIEP
jgi:hypothetical protein